MNHLTTSKTKYGEFSHSDIAMMAVTLLANGKSDFADIDLYRNDSLFKTVLNFLNPRRLLLEVFTDSGQTYSGMITDCRNSSPSSFIPYFSISLANAVRTYFASSNTSGS